MKAFLMHPDGDFDRRRSVPPNAPALTQDPELATLFDAMAAGDDFLREVARIAVLSSLTDPDSGKAGLALGRFQHRLGGRLRSGWWSTARDPAAFRTGAPRPRRR